MQLVIFTCHVKSLKTIQVMVHIFLFVLKNIPHALGNCKNSSLRCYN